MPKNVEELATILGEEYGKASPEMLPCLVESITRRITTVLSTKGGFTVGECSQFQA